MLVGPTSRIFVDYPTGTIEPHFAEGTYAWSNEVYRIYEYERGGSVPTLELGLSNINPTGRDLARALWTEITTIGGGPSSIYTSLIDRNYVTA